jgi:8-oxo-dGTP pyrophosphatase MutT (NUDIX family)
MSYLDEDEDYKFSNNIGWKKKDNNYCSNCGKFGHIYKKCYEPIISYGIICMDINNPKVHDFFITKYKFPNTSHILKHICINKYISKNINCNNRKDLDFYEDKIMNDTSYLIVRRKYTYNYIHILRGLYNELDIETLIKSLNLLTHKEYNNILNCNYNELHSHILWENGDTNVDYNMASTKFNFLKIHILPQIIERIKIVFDEPEWGFPKGKRNSTEFNLKCASREFEEETGLTGTDYQLLNRLYPQIEMVEGSNGLLYKHIYFIGLLNKDFDKSKIRIGKNPEQYLEIGDIGLHTLDKINMIFRDYNEDRKEILNNLKLFLVYNTRYYEKFYIESKYIHNQNIF